MWSNGSRALLNCGSGIKCNISCGHVKSLDLRGCWNICEGESSRLRYCKASVIYFPPADDTKSMTSPTIESPHCREDIGVKKPLLTSTILLIILVVVIVFVCHRYFRQPLLPPADSDMTSASGGHTLPTVVESQTMTGLEAMYEVATQSRSGSEVTHEPSNRLVCSLGLCNLEIRVV